MSTPKWLDIKISIGNIVTIASVIIGLTIGWQTIVGDVRTNAREIAILDARLTVQEAKFDRLLAEMQVERLTMNTILTEMRTDLRFLRQTVESGSLP